MTRTGQLLRIASFASAGLLTGALAAACSSSDKGFDDGPTDNFQDPDAGDASSPPPAEACGLHCSRDLKQVLTGCAGAETVVSQCAAEQGCIGTSCGGACDAAEVNKGSVGCDFWTLSPEDGYYGIGSCYAAMIANTWDRPAAITAEYGTEALDISGATYTVETVDNDAVYKPLTGPLPPGEVAIVFLAHSTAGNESSVLCPTGTNPAMLRDPIRHGTGITTAFHLKSDTPVAAYSIFPYGGASSHVPTATLLLPTSAWEKDYVAVSPHDFADYGQLRTLQIVASEDDTQVTMRPVVEVTGGGGVTSATTGFAQTWTIGRGQVLQFTQRELTGSPITSTKPIAMFGGARCTFLPTEYCDLLQQQISPFAQWGSEYVLAPFKPRNDSFSSNFREVVPYTIVGAIDGTVLTYQPERPRGAPETLNAGETAHYYTDQIVTVRSQDASHPFYAAVYMTGSTYGSGTGTRTTGDPDFVNVPPTAQYLDRYVFFTDHTYPNSTLTFVRRNDGSGFKPVDLDCAGEVTGWQPVGTDGTYEYAWVSLTQSYLPQKFERGECANGRHEAKSEGAFAVTVWGTTLDSSYGYVGGTGLRPINDAVLPPIR